MDSYTENEITNDNIVTSHNVTNSENNSEPNIVNKNLIKERNDHDNQEEEKIQSASIPVEDQNKMELDPYIKERLEIYLAEKGVTNYTFNVSPGSKMGDNFVGIITKVHVQGSDVNGSDIQLNWIVKIAPQAEIFRKMINVEQVYGREVYMYDTVFPTFRKLEKEKCAIGCFNSYPEYVFSYLEPYKECFVMNDMKSIGYILKNKKEPLDVNHVKLVMVAYGKLHALSYALKEQKPDEFAELTNNTKDVIASATNVDDMKKAYETILDQAMSALDPEKDASLIKTFSKYTEQGMDIWIEACMASNQYSVIGHGDSWVTNMLFKYDNLQYPNVPTKVCLLDFQVSRYGSPACDLSYFIFTCTDKTFRDKYYDQMIKLYYYSLCSHLIELGTDPEKYLPFEALQAELKRYSVYGLHMSLMVLTVITREVDEIPDWHKDDMKQMEELMTVKSKNQHLYDERARNVIVDFIAKGYLDFLQ